MKFVQRHGNFIGTVLLGLGFLLLLGSGAISTGCAFQVGPMQWAAGQASATSICELEICETTTTGGQISEMFGVHALEAGWNAITRGIAIVLGGASGQSVVEQMGDDDTSAP